MLKISIVIGSVRMGRHSHKTGQYVARKLSEKQGVEVVILDLLDFNFPVMEERMGIHPNPPARLEEFSDQLKSSYAIVLVSPEYNGSYSGALKNTLDYFSKEFKRKVMGVVTDSAGDFAGISASYQLLLFILKMGAVASPVKLMVPQVQHAFDADGNPVEERTIKGTQAFIDELLWLTQALVVSK
jgi:azobenzene reductase